MTAAERLATAGFDINHLPYGSFSTAESGPKLGVRLGDHVLGVAALLGHAGAAPDDVAATNAANLDTLLTRDRAAWDRVRTGVVRALTDATVAETVVAEAIPLLSKVGANAARLNAIAEEVMRVEGRADDLHEQGLKDLFRHHGRSDPMAYLIGSEIYGQLEKVVDRFEDVANEISGIVIENV